jgi:hypothetical protein
MIAHLKFLNKRCSPPALGLVLAGCWSEAVDSMWSHWINACPDDVAPGSGPLPPKGLRCVRLNTKTVLPPDNVRVPPPHTDHVAWLLRQDDIVSRNPLILVSHPPDGRRLVTALHSSCAPARKTQLHKPVLLRDGTQLTHTPDGWKPESVQCVQYHSNLLIGRSYRLVDWDPDSQSSLLLCPTTGANPITIPVEQAVRVLGSPNVALLRWPSSS